MVKRVRMACSIFVFLLTSGLLAVPAMAGTEPPQIGYAGLRNAAGRLQNYILNLSAAHGKVAPLVIDQTGNLTVVLNMSLEVISISDVNDAGQTLTTASHLKIIWHDSVLSWDPADYNNIPFIELPSRVIWAPDIIIVNSVDTIKVRDFMDKVAVYSNGSIEIKTFLSIETFCPMDHTFFPFDEQSCPIIFYAFSSYVQWRINTETRNIFASNWDLLHIMPRVTYLPLYQRKLPLIQVTLRRKTTFYSICFGFPLILTSYLNTLVFLVPLQSEGKVSYLLTIFFSFSVYLSFFSDVMPRSLDSLPGSMELLICVTVESLVVLIVTLIIMRRFRQEQEQARNEHCNTERAMDNRLPRSQGDGQESERKISSRTSDQRCGLLRCCGSRNRVVPQQLEEIKEIWADEPLKKEKVGCFKFTAQRLDGIFFVLTLVCNSVALFVILFASFNLGDYIP